jgi:hypothetical protein
LLSYPENGGRIFLPNVDKLIASQKTDPFIILFFSSEMTLAGRPRKRNAQGDEYVIILSLVELY